MFTVFSAEMFIISFSVQYYLNIGLEQANAQVMAILIEVFYMIFSSINNTAYRVIKYTFLALSIFTVAYSTFTKDEGIQRLLEARHEEKAFLLESKRIIQDEINEAVKEKAQIGKIMDEYVKLQRITKGRRQLKDAMAENELRLINARAKLEIMNQKIKKYNYSNAGIGIFSLESLSKVQVTTWFMVVSLLMLQLSTSILLPKVIGVIRYAIPKGAYF